MVTYVCYDKIKVTLLVKVLSDRIHTTVNRTKVFSKHLLSTKEFESKQIIGSAVQGWFLVTYRGLCFFLQSTFVNIQFCGRIMTGSVGSKSINQRQRLLFPQIIAESNSIFTTSGPQVGFNSPSGMLLCKPSCTMSLLRFPCSDVFILAETLRTG
jgi:hypothetical protein